MKLWGGRFRSEENKLMEEFNKSFGFDSLLYKKDIEGSLAHVYMQVEVGLLTEEEGKVITNGLKSIEKDTQTIITSVDTILFEEEFLKDVIIYKVDGGKIV